MNIDPVYENILKLKQAITTELLKDADYFGFAKTHKTEVLIDVSATMMLVWAADYAARQRAQPSIADELLNKVILTDLQQHNVSRTWTEMSMMHGPNFSQSIYAEFSQTMERTLSVRNQIGFAFFEHALGRVSIFKGVAHGRKYKEIVDKCISFFLKWNFGDEMLHGNFEPLSMPENSVSENHLSPTSSAMQNMDFKYDRNGDAITITRYTRDIAPGGAVSVPVMIDGLPVTCIGDETFNNCTSLTSVVIGNCVTNIESKAFRKCTGLTNVTIPGGITSIGSSAFAFCFNLIRVLIGENVATMGDGVFAGCGKLEGVYFKGDAPSCGLEIFRSANNATVYYVQGTVGWGATFCGRPTAMWNGVSRI